MQCIKHTKVVQKQKVEALSKTEVTAHFHNGRQNLLSMTSLAMSQADSNFKEVVQKMNTLFFRLLLIESYDRTTDRLWWIWHTSWLRVIDTDDALAYWDMSVEWMTKPRVSDIQYSMLTTSDPNRCRIMFDQLLHFHRLNPGKTRGYKVGATRNQSPYVIQKHVLWRAQ